MPICTLLLLARCGGSDLTLPSESAPADLALVDGNNQNGTAGQPLTNPIVVKVTDRRGQPVPRQKVAFALVTEAPGAVVIPDTAETGTTARQRLGGRSAASAARNRSSPAPSGSTGSRSASTLSWDPAGRLAWKR